MLMNFLSSIKAEQQHLSQVLFYFTGPQVKQLLLYYCEWNGVLFLLFCKLTAKEMRQRPFFITNSRAPYMTCAVKLQTF